MVMMTPGARTLIQDILSTLLPRPCPLCRQVPLKRQEGFCPACLENFLLIRPPLCSLCGEPLQGSSREPTILCPTCLSAIPGRSPLPSIRSCAMYTGTLRKAILNLKYRGQLHLAASLGLFLKGHYHRYFYPHRFDLLLPVPVHPRRLRERGFNQCVLFSRPLAKHLGLPLDLRSVQRIRYTASQSASRLDERKRNLKDAFRPFQPHNLDGKAILIIDDVYTTGATLEALAEALFSSGARDVAALTLARSPSAANDPFHGPDP